MKKKIVVFTGAGISAESGVLTFRDVKDGLWNNYKIDEVATPEGWTKDAASVLKFYNERRQQMPVVEPNAAHKSLAELEKDYDVTVVTQNVDDLHERGGSTNIIHLHGELTKVRGEAFNGQPDWLDKAIEIGYKDVSIGDMCPVSNSQLRPHIVWFGEYPFNVTEAYRAMEKADVLLIVGTSLQIGYTLNLLLTVKDNCEIYYIDPNPMNYLDNYNLSVNYVKKKAVEGVNEVVIKLLKENILE